MTEKIHLKFINQVEMKVEANPGTIMELADAFTFFADNYKFSPKYKSKVWDGKISLINRYTGITYTGLTQQIKRFCDLRKYELTFDDEMIYDNVSEIELSRHLEKITPKDLDARDYQFKSILKCIRSKRRTLESPTSSGKSYMIYAISTWYSNHKTLLIVPSTGLVNQMEDDFRDYGYNGTIHKSTDGLSKSNDIPADIVITTWQSLNNGKYKMHSAWYEQFGVVFGDECHGCKATCLVQIMKSLKNCKYRFGTTGTLDNNQLNTFTIEGLFGPRYKSITTKEMIESGYASKLKIKCIILKYSQSSKIQAKGLDYQKEIEFIVNHSGRTNFVKNLALSLKGNKIVFFNRKEHGKLIYDSIESEICDKDALFFIDGSIKPNDRQRIKKAIEDEENSVLVASILTTGTGVSIKRLHHMIFGNPYKSMIKVLQAIGRLLRIHKEKDTAFMYDIVDDLSMGSRKNYCLKHFEERIKIYENEGFDYEIYVVSLKE